MRKMVCDKVDGVEAAEAEEEEAGYRTKNKNPTQRCGEKTPPEDRGATSPGNIETHTHTPYVGIQHDNT